MRNNEFDCSIAQKNCTAIKPLLGPFGRGERGGWRMYNPAGKIGLAVPPKSWKVMCRACSPRSQGRYSYCSIGLFPADSSPAASALGSSGTFEHLASYNLRHPVLLALTIPVALAAWGYRYADDFARSAAEFALFLSGIFFLQTNFVELRQQVPALVFLMPAAAAAVRRLSDGQAA